MSTEAGAGAALYSRFLHRIRIAVVLAVAAVAAGALLAVSNGFCLVHLAGGLAAGSFAALFLLCIALYIAERLLNRAADRSQELKEPVPTEAQREFSGRQEVAYAEGLKALKNRAGQILGFGFIFGFFFPPLFLVAAVAASVYYFNKKRDLPARVLTPQEALAERAKAQTQQVAFFGVLLTAFFFICAVTLNAMNAFARTKTDLMNTYAEALYSAACTEAASNPNELMRDCSFCFRTDGIRQEGTPQQILENAVLQESGPKHYYCIVYYGADGTPTGAVIADTKLEGELLPCRRYENKSDRLLTDLLRGRLTGSAPES